MSDHHQHDGAREHDHSHGHDHRQGTGHGHDDDRAQGHGHSHGIVDPAIATSKRGLWAIKWSFIGLVITAALQVIVVFISGSVALLADTIHNLDRKSTRLNSSHLGISYA